MSKKVDTKSDQHTQGISKEELSRSFKAFEEKANRIHRDLFNESMPRKSDIEWGGKISIIDSWSRCKK